MIRIPDPILITGAARSGTSIVAGIVHYCGAWGGKMTGPTPYNKKGQFENGQIRNALVKPFLRSIGCDPLGQHPLPDLRGFPVDTQWRNKVLSIMREQGYKKGPWFYKGAKMCLFWPQWHFAFPNAKWVIVRREEDGIVNSCLKTGFMRAFRNAKGWRGWVQHHLVRFQEMRDAGLDVVEVWPSKVIVGNFGEMKNAISHIGLNWNRDIIHDFIEPRLWHKTKKKEQENVA